MRVQLALRTMPLAVALFAHGWLACAPPPAHDSMMQASIVSTSRSPPPPLADVVRASLGERVVQAAAFLYCFQIHSRTNFSVSVFHARFHVSHFSTSPSDRKASPSSVDTASQRCARFLDNKQVSQAEILENYQALPFCSRVSKRQRARSRYSCEHFRDHHKVLCCSRVSMTT